MSEPYAPQELSPQELEQFWQTFRETARVLVHSDPAYFVRLVHELQAVEVESVRTTRRYPEPLAG